MNLIAYGSLMNQTQVTATLGRPAALTPLELPGYARVFNAPFDGYAFLNLVEAPDTTIEVATFTIEPPELARFAEREAGSQLVPVLPDYYAFVWPMDRTAELPVLQSYLAVCAEGAQSLGLDADRGLIAPARVVNDLRAPLYL
jgi:hypothetical protein